MTHTRLPLPDPCPMVLPTGWIRYTADQMHEYADAETAALREQMQRQKDKWLAWDAKRSGFEKAVEQVRVLREALHRIARWKEGPEVNESFDEPGAASIARAALEAK